MAPRSEAIAMTPSQLQELLESGFNVCIAKEVPKLVKGMVSTLAEGLTKQVTASTMAHSKRDVKIDRIVGSVSAMGQRMRANEAKSQELEARIAEQLEIPRTAAAELKVSGEAIAAWRQPDAGRGGLAEVEVHPRLVAN